ncbi:MAG: hypothetical protein ACRETA_00425 [Gammaproteobacteria bacterium]
MPPPVNVTHVDTEQDCAAIAAGITSVMLLSPFDTHTLKVTAEEPPPEELPPDEPPLEEPPLEELPVGGLPEEPPPPPHADSANANNNAVPNAPSL